jgi:hypothetical protein
MKKLLVLALALSVMTISVAAMAQSMAQDSGQMAPAAPLKNIKGTIKFDGDKAGAQGT